MEEPVQERRSVSDRITRHLEGVAQGETGSADRLAAAVLDQLRSIARREMSIRGGSPGSLTLEPGMLASDALMKVFGGRPRFENRRHFFAYATRIMVRALIDYQRERRTKRRGGDLVRVTLSGLGESDRDLVDVEALPPSLARLAELDARKAEVVQLRVFWGLTVPEVAEVLETSPSTVDREWRFARRWLATELRSRPAAPGGVPGASGTDGNAS
ncbi:MAG: ECF-type sigma factor [Acidobacteriota bacterium]